MLIKTRVVANGRRAGGRRRVVPLLDHLSLVAALSAILDATE